MSDSYHAQMYLAAHMKADHGYTWRQLRAIFSGRGEHFWLDVRHKVKLLEAEDGV